jgi:hypothetical protein
MELKEKIHYCTTRESNSAAEIRKNEYERSGILENV